MAYVNNTSVAHHGLLFRFGEAIKSFGEQLEKRRLYRETVSELYALNGRELRDLGLTRSMIRRTAYEAAYGKK